MTTQEVLLLRRKLDLLLRTGKLLMESAADTNRIDRNMKRVAAFLGIPEEKLHIDIRWSMMMVNVSDEAHSFSKFQKCEKHGINMTTLSAISKLSWRAIEQDYSLDKYESELERIANKPRNFSSLVVSRSRFRLWRLLQIVRLRLGSLSISIHLCFFRLPSPVTMHRIWHQCVYEYGNSRLFIHLFSLFVLFFRLVIYTLSSLVGLCPFYCPRCSIDQFCG